ALASSTSVSFASTPGGLTVSGVSSAVSYASAAATGASFTDVTVIVNVCVADVSEPLAAPPSSRSTSVTTAVPNASGAEVNPSVPSLLTLGTTAKSAGLVLARTTNVSVWPPSFGAP